jgi:phosphatidylserine synthase
MASPPAIVLMSFGNFEPIFLAGAFIMLAAAAIRLSYFSTFGLSGSSKYTGLALDNNSLILVSVFLFESVLSVNAFTNLLFVSAVGLAILNVSQIKTPKLSGNPINVYILGFYTVGISVIYVWKLL